MSYIRHDRQTDLERHIFMLGEARGRLAVTLDVLTDALILVGQHNVYCHAPKEPRDLATAREHLEGAKDLIRDVLEHLNPERNQVPTGVVTPPSRIK